jgi:hypothetical protein
MIHLLRSLRPEDPMIISAWLICNLCDLSDETVIQMAHSDSLFTVGVRLRIYARCHAGWRSRTIRDPETGLPVRADLCANCERLTARAGPSDIRRPDR